MKITTYKMPLSKLVFAGVFLSIFLSIYSCQDNPGIEDTPLQITGTWHQTSRTVDGISAPLDSTRMLIQIDTINICVICDSSYTAVSSGKIVSRSGWSYSNGLLNIAVDIPASWTFTTGTNTLTLERVDFNQEGDLVKTALDFERMANIEIE